MIDSALSHRQADRQTDILMELQTGRQLCKRNRQRYNRETDRQTLAKEAISFERSDAKRRASLLSDSTQSNAKAWCNFHPL